MDNYEIIKAIEKSIIDCKEFGSAYVKYGNDTDICTEWTEWKNNNDVIICTIRI